MDANTRDDPPERFSWKILRGCCALLLMSSGAVGEPPAWAGFSRRGLLTGSRAPRAGFWVESRHSAFLHPQSREPPRLPDNRPWLPGLVPLVCPGDHALPFHSLHGSL